jgi:IclR family acetate operon transcriptional repressor
MQPAVLNSDRGRLKEINETPSIQSLDRGLQILETVGRSPEPVALGQLTAMLGIDHSSAFRLANTLKRRGFLANPSAGKGYVLGPSVWRLSRQYDWSHMLSYVAHDHLKALAFALNETAHLAIREGRRALFIDHVISSHVITVSGQTGELVPLHCTSHGKALLADFEERDLANLLGRKPLRAFTQKSIQSIRALAKECSSIRSQGFASDEAEYVEGLCCVAAPVRDRDGAVIASIGISAPAVRFPREREGEYAARVVTAAAQIGEIFRSAEE